MRILYVGNWLRHGHFCSDEIKVARAMTLEGHDVRCVSYGRRKPPPDGQYDVVLWSKVKGGADPEDIEEYRRHLGCKQVVWMWDAAHARPAFEWWWQCVPVFDCVFHNELGLFPKYEAKYGTPWRYLDSACDPEYHAPAAQPRDDWQCDVGFIGTAYGTGGRIDLLKRLAREFSTRAWSTAPDAWRQRGIPCDGPVFGHDIATACASASIMIGCSYKSWCEGAWSNRIYTVLGSGGFYLTQIVPGLHNHFARGCHLVTYGNVEDCVRLCRHWLVWPEKREAVAACGAAHVRLRHMWRHRVREMVTYLRELNLIGAN